MKTRNAFLDASTIGPGIVIGRPGFEHESQHHDSTAPDTMPACLDGVSIAITNKVVLREGTQMQLPGLRLIAVATTG